MPTGFLEPAARRLGAAATDNRTAAVRRSEGAKLRAVEFMMSKVRGGLRRCLKMEASWGRHKFPVVGTSTTTLRIFLGT